jgi:hypothetical protein
MAVAHALLRAVGQGLPLRLYLSRDKAAHPGCPSSTLV